MSSSAPTHVTQSLVDRKKDREMAQARQSGSAPPEMDVKTGSMINPHNPEFITKRPWYLGKDEGPSLDHQGAQQAEADLEFSLTSAEQLVKQQRESLKKAQLEGAIKVGMWVEALKHGRKPYRICQVVRVSKKKRKEYDVKYEDGTLEKKVRPSNIRITKTGARAMHVDTEQFGKETYDSKRDSYHGFEITSAHTKRMEERYKEREALRRKERSKEEHNKQKEQQQEQETRNNHDNSDSDSDIDDSDVGSDSDDEFVQKDQDDKTFTSRLARQGGVGGAQMKVTARNLRIREDTAKYLRNLNPNSAYYDPKSRSMRDNPNPNVPTEDLQFAGDNFARISGDAIQLADTQLFAWDAQDKNVSLHVQANPSQAELLKKQFKTKSANLKTQRKQAVLDKYGGAEYLDGKDGLASAAAANKDDDVNEETTDTRKVRFGVSVSAQQYTRDGRQVTGTKQRVALESKYEQDVYTNGHTAVWGSYFHKGAFSWGYADDHSLIHNSYGTGINGRIANDEANELRYGTGVAGSAALAQARQMLKATTTTTGAAEEGKTSRTAITNSQLYGEANQDAKLDQDKVKAAQIKLREQKEEAQSDRKRKYNSLNSDDVNVTEEDMEAYRLQKGRSDDPMAKISSDQVMEYQ